MTATARRSFQMRGVDPGFDWSQSRDRSNVPWDQTVLLMTHVRGYNHAGIREFEKISAALTPASRPEKLLINPLLGVTSGKLLPIYTFITESHLIEKG